MHSNRYNTVSERIFVGFIYVFIAIFALFCFIPFYLIYVNSVADESILARGLTFIPKIFSLEAYKFLFSSDQIYRSFGISIFITVVGTALSVVITAMYAYVASHKKIKYGNFLSFYIYFTMLFTPGLVGYYLLITRWMNLKNSIWSLIIPGLFSVWNAFLFSSFFKMLPYELYEAAEIDGANDIFIFFKIIWPVSKPILATVTLFNALAYWNDWFNALLFIDDSRMHPLQMLIRTIIGNASAASTIPIPAGVSIPTFGTQLATVCVTIGPIVLLYPFLQKYFVKGITIGAVKG